MKQPKNHISSSQVSSHLTTQDAMNLYLVFDGGENADLRVYGGHGHDILLEKKPKKVHSDIKDFLKSL